MIDPTLQAQLEPVARRYRRVRQLHCLAKIWTAFAIVGLAVGGLAWLARLGTGWIGVLLALAGAGAAYQAWRRQRAEPTDWKGVARLIEKSHPELGSILVTAVEQEPEPTSGRLNYLQAQIVRQAFYESRKRSWRDAIPEGTFFAAHCLHWVALAIFVGELLVFANGEIRTGAPSVTVGSVEVIPGDTSVEEGQDVTVLARFPEGRVPADPEMVMQSALQPTRRIPLDKNLEDPVFSATVKGVVNSFDYRIVYGDEQTRDFEIEVFTYPALRHADARIVYPEFTGLTDETLKDTRRISAVQGSQLRYSFFANKPVASARLLPQKGQGKPVDLAVVSSNQFRAEWVLEQDRAYDLVLKDQAGHTNQSPPRFQIDVLKNKKPELQFVFPSGDQQVSPLEEITFEAVASDDFGLKRYGLAFSQPGKESRFIELGGPAKANKEKELQYLLSLEELSVKPDQLISYFLWAEDLGPNGEVRRSYGDLRFLEVRPFEEVFREAPSTASSQSNSSRGGSGSSPQQLVELQKKVINATWNLRDKADDLKQSAFEEQKLVVLKAQRQAAKQLTGLKRRLRDPSARPAMTEAEEAMDQALKHLGSTKQESSTGETSAWAKALKAEQAAYQALLRIEANEQRVAQGRQQGGGSNRGSRAQRQLDQLDLKQSENRYETERQASALNNPQQQEQLDIMKQLETLAQRQSDLNERLRELQTALQSADSKEEKEAVRRRLKRLQEEERETLRELDKVRQRLAQQQSPESAESLSRLNKTRSELQKAAEQLDKEAVSQALASGSRVQRNLEEVRKGLRQETSSEFAGALREIRSRARALVEQEERLRERLTEIKKGAQRSLSGGKVEQITNRFAGQREKTTELLDRIETVSQQAESVEPLLAQQLYEALRQADQSEGAKQVLPWRFWEQWHNPELGNLENSLRLSRKLLENGLKPLAEQVEKKAYEALVQLKKQVESTTDEILGSELKTLRLARNELDNLVQDVKEEMKERETGAPGGNRSSEQAQTAEQSQGDKGAQGGKEQQAASRDQSGERGQTGRTQGASQAQAAGRDRAVEQNAQRGSGSNPTRQSQQRQSGVASGPESERGQTESTRSGSGGAGRDAERSQTPNTARGGGAADGRAATGDISSTLKELEKQLADENARSEWNGPIAGEGFDNWLERLQNLREMLGEEAWRRQVGQVVDRARSMRSDVKRNNTGPKWGMVQSEIIRPLTELRDRIGEELARLGSKDALVPLERDAVPREYSEFVREYYERLGNSEVDESRR